jgi:hypothetical protein
MTGYVEDLFLCDTPEKVSIFIAALLEVDRASVCGTFVSEAWLFESEVHDEFYIVVGGGRIGNFRGGQNSIPS